jgi:hypothetical protein
MLTTTKGHDCPNVIGQIDTITRNAGLAMTTTTTHTTK